MISTITNHQFSNGNGNGLSSNVISEENWFEFVIVIVRVTTNQYSLICNQLLIVGFISFQNYFVDHF